MSALDLCFETKARLQDEVIPNDFAPSRSPFTSNLHPQESSLSPCSRAVLRFILKLDFALKWWSQARGAFSGGESAHTQRPELATEHCEVQQVVGLRMRKSSAVSRIGCRTASAG